MTLGRGIPNLGNTCYVNSILQCLRYSKELVYSLKSHDTTINSALVASLIELFYNGAPINNLYTFLRELQKTKEFTVLRQCDAHELFLFLMDKCFEELKLTNPFEGQQISTVTCSECHNKSVLKTPYVTISLQMNNTESTVSNMFQEYCGEETLDALIQCDRCEKKTKSTKTLSIIPGDIVVYHLKRFGAAKINTPVRIEEEIEILGKPYRLYASCNHAGNLSGGHYTAACMKRDGSWALCNDDDVQEMSTMPESSERPYILFYCKKI